MVLHLAWWSLLLLVATLLQVQGQATAKGDPESPETCSSSRIQQSQLCTNDTALCGYVLLCEGGEERLLCDRNWTTADATVACKQLANSDSGVPRPDFLSTTTLDIPASTFAPSCSGAEDNLAECQNDTSSNTDACPYQQFAAGVICFNSTPTSSAIPEPTTVDAATMDIAPPSAETPSQLPSSQNLPTSSSFTSPPPTTDPTPTSTVSTDTESSSESNSDSLTIVIYIVTAIAVLIFIAIIVLAVLICSIKTLHRSRVKDAEPASPTADKPVLNNQVDRAVPEPVYAEPKPTESPRPIRASNPSFQYHIYQEVGPEVWSSHQSAQAAQTENVPQLKDGLVPEVHQLEASSSGYSSLENGRQYATLEPYTASGSSSHSNSTNSSSLLNRSMKSSTLPLAASDRSPAGSKTAGHITGQVQGGRVEVPKLQTEQQLNGGERQEGDYATLNLNGVQYATLEPYIPKKETHSPSASPNEDNTYSQLNRCNTMPAATERCHTTSNEHMMLPQGKVLLTEC